jgi:hypothetical protein
MRPDRAARPQFVDVRRFRRPGVILPALLFFLAAFALHANAAPQSPSNPNYNSVSFVQELNRLKTGLDGAGKSDDALRAYREALPKTWPVDAGGRHFDVPTNALTSRLGDAEKHPDLRQQRLKEAREYLDSLAAETSSLSGEPTPAQDSARPKLDAILARPEYAHVRQQNWYEKLRQRINDLLFRALVRLLRGAGGQATLGYILLWIALAAAVVLIAYWVFRNWFRTARATEMALAGAAVPARSWQEWVFAAREAAARGDYRLAIHCAYWAGIARLQDLGVLSPDRTKTPREYLRAFAESKLVFVENPAMRREALERMTSRLEKTWYGYHTASEADFRDSLAQLEILGCRLP